MKFDAVSSRTELMQDVAKLHSNCLLARQPVNMTICQKGLGIRLLRQYKAVAYKCTSQTGNIQRVKALHAKATGSKPGCLMKDIGIDLMSKNFDLVCKTACQSLLR